jgi:hypothetical protein
MFLHRECEIEPKRKEKVAVHVNFRRPVMARLDCCSGGMVYGEQLSERQPKAIQ